MEEKEQNNQFLKQSRMKKHIHEDYIDYERESFAKFFYSFRQF